MKPGAYFRPNQEGEAVLAAGKRLYKRAPDYGTWYVRYKDASGAIRREACAEALEEAATNRAMALHLLGERRRKGLEPAEFNIIPCNKLHSLYLEAHAHLSSQAPMRSQMKAWFDPHFGRKPTSDVTPADCEALLAKARAAGQAETTVRQLHIRGRLVWKFGVTRLRVARENPWASVPRPSVAERKVLFLSREQVEAIIRGAGEHRLLILLAVLTGGRRGEFGGLKWSDFHFDEGPCGTVHYQRSWGRATTKTSKARVVPLHQVLIPEIKRAQLAATHELVFPSRKGEMRRNSWHVTNILRAIAARARVELPAGVTFHTLRKTFVTHLIRDTGGDISVAQQLAGHSTPAVTARYYVGRDVEHHASQLGALRLVSASAVEHATSTRNGDGRRGGRKSPVNQGTSVHSASQEPAAAFIFEKKTKQLMELTSADSDVFPLGSTSGEPDSVDASRVQFGAVEHVPSTPGLAGEVLERALVTLMPLYHAQHAQAGEWRGCTTCWALLGVPSSP